ncbi:hypothetical protein H0H92_002866 [Tricholoma furcatifolium]|nr:hypothetical protein H0H92_002866 [Tricholoma furcatifolium]
MQHIDPTSLNRLPTHIAYLRNFIDFSAEDAAALHAAQPVIAPLVPAVLDAVYDKLVSFEITAQVFLPRQAGYTEESKTRLEDLDKDHPIVKFRKDFLAGYIANLFSLDYESDASWEYLDMVATMHTGSGLSFVPGEKTLGRRVEYMHCAAVLGFLEDALLKAVVSHSDLDAETKVAVTRAVNKLLWIQNDLFARRYMKETSVSLSVNTSGWLVVAACVVTLGLYLAQYVVPRFL